MNCDRCNASTHGYDLMDFCAVCSKNLCAACMEKGCCGHVPAKSGEELDAAYDEKVAQGELDADANAAEAEEMAGRDHTRDNV